jgi:transglutaminase-like putative cysteine protease
MQGIMSLFQHKAEESKMKNRLIFFILLFVLSVSHSLGICDIETLVEKGELSEAEEFIKTQLATSDTLTQTRVRYFKDQLNKIQAIRGNYPYKYQEMFTKLKSMVPDLTNRDIERWEKNTTLEYRIVDGQKLYFWAFPYNLFALNKDAEKRKIKDDTEVSDSESGYDHTKHKRAVIDESQKSRTAYILPKKIRVSFTFFEDVTDIPEGEIIRGWLPVPRESLKQRDIRILEVEPSDYIVSNKGKYLNACIYIEKPVIRKSRETVYWKNYFADPPEKWVKPLSSPDKYIDNNTLVFRVVFEYTAYAYYREIDSEEILPYDRSSVLYRKYTKEKLPHIKFTDYLSRLSNQIVEGETNDYLKAKNIYSWICENVIWTNPDYDSPSCLSDYTAKAKRGDCGTKALLFTTLCRLNGIPARLQGGWMTRPGRQHSQHGWAQMYVEPYGWLTVDPDAGSKFIDSEDEKLRFFHFGNCGSYRLITYDDNIPLFPYKVHGASSGGSVAGGLQIGAFEWAGGELESNVKIDTYVEE